jgi:hypothetical protein
MNEDTIDLSDMAYTTLTGRSSWTTMNSITGAVGSTGGLYTVTGSNGTSASWNDTVTISSSANLSNTLHVRGDAEFEGDVKIGGKSIADSIDRIEERLAILRPNEELEEKWENLRGLRKMYMDLEAEIIEKEKMWSILKK